MQNDEQRSSDESQSDDLTNVKDFLNEISKDEKSPFDSEVFNPTESLPEKEEEKVGTPLKEEPKPEDNLPFHTHPRFKALTHENREIKEEMVRLKQLLQDKADSGKPVTNADIPPWLKTLMGDDPELYNQFTEYQSGLIKTVVNEVTTRQQAQIEQSQAEQEKWKAWVDDQFDELQVEGKKFNKEEVGKIALKYLPQDNQGNISIRKAYEIWEEKSELERLRSKDPAKSQAKKEIAAKTLSGGGAAPQTSVVLTSKDLRGKSMYDLI